MRHPAEYFIRCLLCSAHEDQDIATTMSAKGLHPPDMSEIGNIRARLGDIPEIDDIPDPDTSEWLRSRGIFTYFFDREKMHRAESILNTPRAREEVEYHLLARIPPEEIIGYLQSKPQFHRFNVLDLRYYKHYFWNTDLLTFGEMARYASRHSGSDRYLEALNGGRTAALWRMGIDTPMTDDELHRAVYRQLGMRMLILGEAPYTSNTDKRAVALANIVTRMWKDMKIVGSAGVEEAYERMRKFVEERHAPQIGSIEDGRHYLTEGEIDDVEASEPDPGDVN